MDDNEIKKANRKALPKYILILVISLIIGGAIGFLAAKYEVENLAAGIQSAGAFFAGHIAPWAMLALAILVPFVCAGLYKKAKGLLADWDGENEKISDAIDEKLSVIVWITSGALIVSYFLIAAAYSGGFTAFENKESILPFVVCLIAFLGILAETVIIQQKCVDASKKTNPEKTASVYDTKFHKKWMDSCDEAEKIMVGKCAFKAYNATNSVCSALAMILAICALIFGIGFLPSLAVCIVWIVNLSVYCKEALKYSKAGNKIS